MEAADGAVHHYSPASAGGGDSAAMAKRVSDAYCGLYERDAGARGMAAERLLYPPEGQPRDDPWSGSRVDEMFWRADASLLAGRSGTGMTREQRRLVDGPPPEAAQPTTPSGLAPPVAGFLQSTKSRLRG